MEGMKDGLWAPWRIGFILGPPAEGCFLCDASYTLADAARNEENLVLEQGERCFVIMNRYPYNGGHLLIAPRLHGGDFTVLDDETVTELGLLTRRWLRVLTDAMHPDGFNVGYNLGKAAGAGLAGHLHAHVVPRWDGDTNFMSVCTDYRIINQSLLEAWQLLRKTREPT